MEHNLFKSRTFEEGKHSVTGDCNGLSMATRWELETPIFAREINKHIGKEVFTVLDYGTGVGRIAKELMKLNEKITVIGVDDSSDQLKQAKEYINHNRFLPMLPHELGQTVDLCYCIYVLQHVPAVELRGVLQRIHHFLKDCGIFIYGSSDYRMAIRFDGKGFHDDRYLGVNIQEEISRAQRYPDQ